MLVRKYAFDREMADLAPEPPIGLRSIDQSIENNVRDMDASWPYSRVIDCGKPRNANFAEASAAKFALAR